MVNYRRVVCEVALLAALAALCGAAPAPDCAHGVAHTHYDQRQNGTENYRLNIDGVVVAVAPAESLLSALGDMDDLMELLDLEDLGDLKPKPPPSSSSSTSTLLIPSLPAEPEKPLLQKPQDKPTESKPEAAKPEDMKPMEEKPQEEKPAAPEKPAEAPLSDVSLGDDLKLQKKEVSGKKQEKAKRLKNRLAAFLMPLLRKTRHH